MIYSDNTYEIIKDITKYTRREFKSVYDLKSAKWYMLNNLGQYEEYGVFGDSLDTYYTGKLSIVDGHEYEWDGTQWNDLGEAIFVEDYVPLNEYFVTNEDIETKSINNVHFDMANMPTQHSNSEDTYWSYTQGSLYSITPRWSPYYNNGVITDTSFSDKKISTLSIDENGYYYYNFNNEIYLSNGNSSSTYRYNCRNFVSWPHIYTFVEVKDYPKDYSPKPAPTQHKKYMSNCYYNNAPIKKLYYGQIPPTEEPYLRLQNTAFLVDMDLENGMTFEYCTKFNSFVRSDGQQFLGLFGSYDNNFLGFDFGFASSSHIIEIRYFESTAREINNIILNTSTKYIFNLSNNTLNINSTNYSYTPNILVNRQEGPIAIGCKYNNQTKVLKTNADINFYYFKIFKNNNLVYHFVPNSDGRLYERVNGNYYTAEPGGTVTYVGDMSNEQKILSYKERQIYGNGHLKGEGSISITNPFTTGYGFNYSNSPFSGLGSVAVNAPSGVSYLYASDNQSIPRFAWSKITFSGIEEFKLYYYSYGESSYDYVDVFPMDFTPSSQSSESGYEYQTKSNQNVWKTATYQNDGNEHFIYICYKKDGSGNQGADTGAFTFPEDYKNYIE